jgi:hypothetical protein
MRLYFATSKIEAGTKYSVVEICDGMPKPRPQNSPSSVASFLLSHALKLLYVTQSNVVGEVAVVPSCVFIAGDGALNVVGPVAQHAIGTSRAHLHWDARSHGALPRG